MWQKLWDVLFNIQSISDENQANSLWHSYVMFTTVDMLGTDDEPPCQRCAARSRVP